MSAFHRREKEENTIKKYLHYRALTDLYFIILTAGVNGKKHLILCNSEACEIQ